MSDHYTMISQFPSVLDQGRFVNDEKIVVRNLQIIKAEKSLRFLFPLDQKLRMWEKLERENETSLENISKTIMLCVDRFAPEKAITLKNENQDWITNKI